MSAALQTDETASTTTSPKTASAPSDSMVNSGDAVCDVIIVGGGFFGLFLAAHLAGRFKRVVVCERDSDLMQRASYVNQARVHNGYHYPRSILTAYRSHVHYSRFVAEFEDCVDTSFTKLYAIGKYLSKVSSTQFRTFSQRIGAPLRSANAQVKRLFNPKYINDVFEVEECAFDSVKLRQKLRARALAAGVEIRLETDVEAMIADGSGIAATLNCRGERQTLRTARVFQCTYSGINRLLAGSKLPLIPLKYELTEMALVEVPEALSHLGITVMCGPFFSCMPFPARGLHSLSHVRYTPHFQWTDREGLPDAQRIFETARRETHFLNMQRDAQRYVPTMSECVHRDSIWEVKTVLPLSEVDDSRPILFKAHYGLRNHHVIMGGKIDNVYDALLKIDQLLAEDF